MKKTQREKNVEDFWGVMEFLRAHNIAEPDLAEINGIIGRAWRAGDNALFGDEMSDAITNQNRERYPFLKKWEKNG